MTSLDWKIYFFFLETIISNDLTIRINYKSLSMKFNNFLSAFNKKLLKKFELLFSLNWVELFKSFARGSEKNLIKWRLRRLMAHYSTATNAFNLLIFVDKEFLWLLGLFSCLIENLLLDRKNHLKLSFRVWKGWKLFKSFD